MMRKFTLFILLTVSCAFPKQSVAILDFAANGLDKSEAVIIAEKLENEFQSADSFTVVERDKIGDILKEQGFQQTGCTATECAVEVGKILSVRSIVIGSVSKFGNIFSIYAKMIEVETGKIVKSAEYNSDNKLEDLLLYGIADVHSQLTGKKAAAGKTEVRRGLESGKALQVLAGYNMSISPISIEDPDNVIISSGSQDKSISGKGFAIDLLYRLSRHEIGGCFYLSKGEDRTDQFEFIKETIIGGGIEYGYNILPGKNPIRIVTGIKAGYWSIIIDTDTIHIKIPAIFGPQVRFEVSLPAGISLFGSYFLAIAPGKNEVTHYGYKGTVGTPVTNMISLGIGYSFRLN